MVSESLALLVRNLTLVFKVLLVSDEDPCHVLLSILVDLAHPVSNSSEGVSVSDVISHNDAMGTLVVARGDSREPLRSGSVPDLELDQLIVDVDGPNLEINSNGRLEAFFEVVILSNKESEIYRSHLQRT